MKWLILIVVVILAAPTIANRLQALDPDRQDNAANPAATGTRRRGPVYRAVRRFGPRTVLLGSVLIVAILAVAAYLVVRQL